MASIIEETVVVKISRIVKSGVDAPKSVVTPEIMETIEGVADQLFGEHAVVEVTKSDTP